MTENVIFFRDVYWGISKTYSSITPAKPTLDFNNVLSSLLDYRKRCFDTHILECYNSGYRKRCFRILILVREFPWIEIKNKNNETTRFVLYDHRLLFKSSSRYGLPPKHKYPMAWIIRVPSSCIAVKNSTNLKNFFLSSAIILVLLIFRVSIVWLRSTFIGRYEREHG